MISQISSRQMDLAFQALNNPTRNNQINRVLENVPIKFYSDINPGYDRMGSFQGELFDEIELEETIKWNSWFLLCNPHPMAKEVKYRETWLCDLYLSHIFWSEVSWEQIWVFKVHPKEKLQ